MPDEPKLVLHIGQRMIDVADWMDMGDEFYWDDVLRKWFPNWTKHLFNTRLADCLNRMGYQPDGSRDE